MLVGVVVLPEFCQAWSVMRSHELLLVEDKEGNADHLQDDYRQTAGGVAEQSAVKECGVV